jgi:hypothetical protein
MASDAKTIEDLITTLRSLFPQMDDIADRILKENPDLRGIDPLKGPYFELGKLLSIFTMDFLVYAYGKGARGYIHKPSQN